MADASLVFNIIGRDRLGDTLAKAKAEALAASDDSRKGFERLDSQIRETEASIKKLTERFVETGDTDILRDLRKEHKTADGLRKVRGELETLVKGAEAAGSFMTRFGREIAQGGSALGESVGNAIKSHPYIAAGVAAAIVAGAPIIGAALNAVLLLAVGGGTLAAGIALAAGDSRVKAAWSDVGTSILGMLRAAASPLIDPLIRSAAILKGAFLEAISGIRSGFAQVAPLVERFATGLAGMVREIGPGFSRALSASLPILQDLADWLPELGASLGFMFDEIAAGAPGAQMFFRDFLSWTSETIRMIGSLIHFLSDSYIVLRAIGQVMAGDLLGAATTLATGFGDVGSAVKGAVPPMQEFKTEGEKAADALQKMQQSADTLVNKILGLRDADIAFQQSLLAVSQAAKDNGVSLEMNKEAGLKNNSVLDDAIRKAWAHRQAILERTNSIQAADSAFDGEMQALYATAAAAGFNKDKVRAMIEEIRSVPRDTQANIELRNAGKTQDEIREINRMLNTTDGKTANTYINTILTTIRRDKVDNTLARLSPEFRAAGGPVATGRPYVVGEDGPEIIYPTGPGQVIPHRESMALMGGAGAAGGGRAGGGNSYTVNVYGGGDGHQVGAQVVEAIKSFERVNGAGWRSA